MSFFVFFATEVLYFLQAGLDRLFAYVVCCVWFSNRKVTLLLFNVIKHKETNTFRSTDGYSLFQNYCNCSNNDIILLRCCIMV